MRSHNYWRRSLVFWLLLAPLAIINIFPFAVMFATAVKPRDEIFAYPPRWLPTRFAWENFVDMWTQSQFGQALWNSIYITALSVLLTLAVAVPAAYALFRFHFRGRGVYRLFLLVTQMVSPIVLVLGLFRLFVQVGWVDTQMPLIVTYAAFNLAFTIIMLQSYFTTIPLELEEAAWIDGASRLRTIVSIFLPLALPALAVTATFTFVNVWNEFVIALTLLRSQENFTLQLKVFTLASSLFEVLWHQTMAAILVATLPVAVVFLWLQRYLIRGMASGAVK